MSSEQYQSAARKIQTDFLSPNGALNVSLGQRPRNQSHPTFKGADLGRCPRLAWGRALPLKKGGQRLTDVANTETLLRLVQSVPSPKAEPIKLWLAKIGHERMQEMSDPARALERARLDLETQTSKRLVTGENYLPPGGNPSGPELRRSRVVRLDVEESVLFWRGPALDYRGDWGCRGGGV